MAQDAPPPLARVLTVVSVISLLSLATATSMQATRPATDQPAAFPESSPLANTDPSDSALPPPPVDANGHLLPPTGLPSDGNTNLENSSPPTSTPPANQFGCTGRNTFTTRRDGNPYPVCPGPMPSRGGNCTWWAWESWHRLGVNLPGWGNAALWAAAAKRAGFKVGTVPRVNAIAVFPVGDHVWALNSAGHVAFVTRIYRDHNTFDVTYQNYGDPTIEHVGSHYRVSLIQQPQYQHGQLRFIYFPDPKGSGNQPTPSPTPKPAPSASTPTPSPTATSAPPPSGNTTSPDLSMGNFSGDGRTEILRYKRSNGTMDLLSLSPNGSNVRVVPVEDSKTSAGGWGSAWEVYSGDLAGSGHDTLLLYDRTHGIGRFIQFNPDLSVASDVEHTGWKSTWELIIGRFGGTHDGLIIYDRQLDQDHGQWTPTPDELSSDDASAPTDWQHLHRTAILTLIEYNQYLSVKQEASFTHWHNTWEIQPGHFGAEQDGLFLFDRQAGEARILTFTPQMRIAHSYSAHHWNTRWEVYLDNFTGEGWDSLLLFDRAAGIARLLAFTPALKVERSATYTGWARGWAFYPGVWGGTNPSSTGLFLYDQQQGQAAFVAFGPQLRLTAQKTYEGWRHTWKVFVGRFGATCPTGANTPCLSTLLLIDPQAGQAKLVRFQFVSSTSTTQPTYYESTITWPG